jgi:hypothetical protein
MRLSRIRRAVPVLVAAALLAACGGGGGTAGQPGADPASTVNALVATIQQKAFDKLPDLACAASKDAIKSDFDPAGATGSALGVTTADFLAAINIEMANVKVGSPAVTGDTATVHLNADMKMTANKDKLKELVKKILTAQGQDASDAIVNAGLEAMAGQFESTKAVDTDVPLKNEGGKWLICGDIGGLTGS